MKLKNLTEMSLITDNFVGDSMELDFKNDYPHLKLISKDIKPLSNNLYQGHDIFYLTDINDTYLGHLEYDKLDDDKITITTSFSTQRGFYELLFKIILVYTDISMIFGGQRQSINAIKSWKKILTKFNKKIYNTETRQLEDYDFSKESDYWTYDNTSAKKYLVGLSESDNNIKNNFKDADEFLLLRESKGRITIPLMDVLVRYYGLNNNDVLEILRLH